jgi:hypothetical protein
VITPYLRLGAYPAPKICIPVFRILDIDKIQESLNLNKNIFILNFKRK